MGVLNSPHRATVLVAVSEKGTKMSSINLTPTWRGLLPALLQLVQQEQDTEEKSRAAVVALQELTYMATAADKYNELLKRLKLIPNDDTAFAKLYEAIKEVSRG